MRRGRKGGGKERTRRGRKWGGGGGRGGGGGGEGENEEGQYQQPRAHKTRVSFPPFFSLSALAGNTYLITLTRGGGATVIGVGRGHKTLKEGQCTHIIV